MVKLPIYKIMKTEDLKLQIAEELIQKDIDNIDEYIDKLHKILPNYLNNVPARYSKNFYEFAGKFLKYLFDNQDDWEEDIIANIGHLTKVFINCYNEFYNIDLILNDFKDNEDITNDVIKILKSYCDDTSGIIGDLDEAKQILLEFLNLDDIIFIKKLNCDWNKVSESIVFNDFIPLEKEIEIEIKFNLEEFKKDSGKYYPYIYNFDKLSEEDLQFYYNMWSKNKSEVEKIISDLESNGYVLNEIQNKSLPQPKRTKTMEYNGIYPDEWLYAKLDKKNVWEDLDNHKINSKIIKKVLSGYPGILKYVYDLSKNDYLDRYISIDFNELKGTFFSNEKPGYIGMMSGDLKGTRIVAVTIDDLKIYTLYNDGCDTTGFW